VTGVPRCVALFCATLVSVYFTYGWMWSAGDPLGDWDTFVESATFACALMGILLAHEMAHYVVARRHGFELSLPYFIPVPFVAFGTFGAVIGLESRPTSRTALLEMGAAGPIAGALVAFACIAVGLGEIGPATCPEPADLPALLETVFGGLNRLLAPLDEFLAGFIDPPPEGHIVVSILGDPPILGLLGEAVLGEAPGRFDTLGPLTLAGWVGCLLTAMNLIPIGQLDGGHILNAIVPKHHPLISKVLLGLIFAAGFISWPGWAFWGFVVLMIRAWQSVEVPVEGALTLRAKLCVVAVLVAFGLTFMPAPVAIDTMPNPCLAEAP
jgi:membrane-associated protease RseP (regulator of RpoE activity)